MALKAIRVAWDGSKGVEGVSAYTRGTFWNGWENPLMTLDSVLELFPTDSTMNDNAWIVYDYRDLGFLRITDGNGDVYEIPRAPESDPVTGRNLYDFTNVGFCFVRTDAE